MNKYKSAISKMQRICIAQNQIFVDIKIVHNCVYYLKK